MRVFIVFLGVFFAIRKKLGKFYKNIWGNLSLPSGNTLLALKRNFRSLSRRLWSHLDEIKLNLIDLNHFLDLFYHPWYQTRIQFVSSHHVGVRRRTLREPLQVHWRPDRSPRQEKGQTCKYIHSNPVNIISLIHILGNRYILTEW